MLLNNARGTLEGCQRDGFAVDNISIQHTRYLVSNVRLQDAVPLGGISHVRFEADPSAYFTDLELLSLG